MPRRYGHAPLTIVGPVDEKRISVPLVPVVEPGIGEDELSAAEQAAYDEGYAAGFAAASGGFPSDEYQITYGWFDTGSEWELTITVESTDTSNTIGGVEVEVIDLGLQETTDTSGGAKFFIDYGDAGPLELFIFGFNDKSTNIDGP